MAPYFFHIKTLRRRPECSILLITSVVGRNQIPRSKLTGYLIPRVIRQLSVQARPLDSLLAGIKDNIKRLADGKTLDLSLEDLNDMKSVMKKIED